MKITKKLMTSIIVVVIAFSFVFCAFADTTEMASFLNFGTFTDGFFGTFTDGYFGSDTDADMGTSTDGWEIIPGDIDGEPGVTASDARFALRISVGLENCTEEIFAAGDVDHDGKISAADARLILRAAVGLETL